MRGACIDRIYELAKRDPRTVFVGSDLSPGLLQEMKDEMPERYYMEGISEQNVIGMAAGLALEGFVPYVNTIATFITRRCYEQVATDLCLHDLPVRLIGNGGGLVYAPLGPTHLAVEDIAIMRALPNMAVVAVCDAEEMVRFMDQTLDWPHPIYIRLAKGYDPVVSKAENGFTIGKGILMRDAGATDHVAFLTTGVMTTRALAAAETLEAEGVPCSVLHLHTIKPLDVEAVLEQARSARLLVTVEEHTRIGGLGSAVVDTLVDTLGTGFPPVVRLGLPDQFAKVYGSQDSQLEALGLQPDGLARTVRSHLNP